MQRLPKSITPVAVTTTDPAVILTVDSGVTATINNLAITNTSAAVTVFSLYLVPASGTPAADNSFLYQFSLAAGATTVPASAIGLHIPGGSSLQLISDAAGALTVTGGYYATSGS